MKPYQYWGFGLLIHSEIEFPELLPFDFDNKADLFIRRGITPQALIGDDVISKVGVQISRKEYLLQIDQVASYYALNGAEILVQAHAGSDEKSVRLFLLGSVMAAVLHQLDRVVLHASAVMVDHEAVLFCGRSGAGKSTTVTLLQQAGYKVFSDDVCVLKASTDSGSQVEAYPSYPMIKLWRDTFDLLNLSPGERVHKIRPALPKYGQFFHHHFKPGAIPVRAVFILHKDLTIAEPVIHPLSALDGFKYLQKNNYRNLQITAMKKQELHFKTLAQLASAVPVYKLSRPETGDTTVLVAGLIQQYINKHVSAN